MRQELQRKGNRTGKSALRKNGEVWCWGDNSVKQLADGTTVMRSRVPVQVQGL